MEDLTATKLFNNLMLRARDYRRYAIVFRDRADDANSADAREKYLRLAKEHEALAERAEHLAKGRLSSQPIS
jgi:hypothetical protein